MGPDGAVAFPLPRNPAAHQRVYAERERVVRPDAYGDAGRRYRRCAALYQYLGHQARKQGLAHG